MSAKKTNKKRSTSYKQGQSGNLNGRTKGIKDSRTTAKNIKSKIAKSLPGYSLLEKQTMIYESLTKFFDPKLKVKDYEKLVEKANSNADNLSLIDSLAHIIIDEAIVKKDKHTRQFLFTHILQNPVRAVKLNEVKVRLKKVIGDIRKEWSVKQISVDHVADLYLDVSTEFIDDPEVYGMVQQLFKGLLDFIIELEKLSLEKTKVDYSRHNSVTISKLNDILQIVNKNLQRHLINTPDLYEKIYNNMNAEIGKEFLSYLPGELDEKEIK